MAWHHACGIHLVLLWALSSGPLATLALSTDALPKLIPCSLNDSHIPSMHRQQAIYVLDWLLCPSSGRQSLVRHVSCTEVWRWIHQQSPVSWIQPMLKWKKKACLGFWTQSFCVLFHPQWKKSKHHCMKNMPSHHMSCSCFTIYVISLFFNLKYLLNQPVLSWFHGVFLFLQQHDGRPYCHKPCYAALFGPKGSTHHYIQHKILDIGIQDVVNQTLSIMSYCILPEFVTVTCVAYLFFVCIYCCNNTFILPSWSGISFVTFWLVK